jgi:predicted pyridoxine 5'-phosphate oxidase superfamily flavin-nucleotide-binding protein
VTGRAGGSIPAAAREAVARYPLCFVASLREDGSPSVSPKGTVRVWDADHLVFADVASPQTVANVERDDRVHVNVVDHFARRGWRFTGRARVTTDVAVLQAIRDEYPDEPYPFARAVLVRVEEARELVSPSYALGKTEAGLRREYLELGDGPGAASGLLGVRAGVVCARCERRPVVRDGRCEACLAD